MPEVSVVIPLYNRAPHIARALNSVLSQTVQDFEIIVVDDGSTDNGANVVLEFDEPRIHLIKQENQGVSAARNRGIELANAELIAFLDADDEWTPKHLDTLIRLFEKYPDIGAYGTAYSVELPNSTMREVKFHAIPEYPWEGVIKSYFKSAARGEPPISASTVGIPKRILMEMGGFSTSAWWGEDIDLWGRIAMKYPIAFSWEGGGIYHTDAINRASKKIEAIEENIFITSARMSIKSGKLSSEMKKDLLEYVDVKLVQNAARNLQAGRPDLARNNLRNCSTKTIMQQKRMLLFWTYFPPDIFKLMLHLKRHIFINLEKFSRQYIHH